MKQDFEEFLMEKHAEDYVGTKDCMIDDCESWLQDLEVDDFLKYGDEFAKEQSISYKEGFAEGFARGQKIGLEQANMIYGSLTKGR